MATYRFGRGELDTGARRLLVDGQPAALGSRAFDVLLALLERRGRLVTKAELLEVAWPGVVVEENNLQVQVSALRKLLGQESIATVPGRGYRFALEATQVDRATAAGSPSIAVMPFSNISGNPEEDCFADGLVEDIITTLSKLRELRVIARNSTFAYKGRAIDVRAIGRELDVQYVLEGSVRKADGRMRVSLQLIDAATGVHVWANRYDRPLEDLFALQDEITLLLATEMQVHLTAGEQARIRYTTTSQFEAWSWWVKGLAHFRGPVTRDNLTATRRCWEQAIALDPGSAALNAALAFIHCSDARFGWWNDRASALRSAGEYAQRGLAIDPTNADLHTSLSLWLLIQGRHEEAVEQARQAVDLGPGSADVAAFASFVFACSGHADDAILQIEKAMKLSPKYPASYLGHLGNAYRLAGRHDEAIDAFKMYGQSSPGAGLVDLVLCFQHSGRAKEASAAARQLTACNPRFSVTAWKSTQLGHDTEQLDADVAALRAAGLPA